MRTLSAEDIMTVDDAAMTMTTTAEETDPYKYAENIGEKRLEAAVAKKTATVGPRRTEVNTTGNIVNIGNIAPHAGPLDTADLRVEETREAKAGEETKTVEEATVMSETAIGEQRETEGITMSIICAIVLRAELVGTAINIYPITAINILLILMKLEWMMAVKIGEMRIQPITVLKVEVVGSTEKGLDVVVECDCESWKMMHVEVMDARRITMLIMMPKATPVLSRGHLDKPAAELTTDEMPSACAFVSLVSGQVRCVSRP